MKETNLDTIQSIAIDMIVKYEPIALKYIDTQELSGILTNAYCYNDSAKETTHRVNGSVTLIFTQTAVSLIFWNIATRYKSAQPLCLYENLAADITNLLSCVDFCFERLDERM